jgi:hypothetical protein
MHCRNKLSQGYDIRGCEMKLDEWTADRSKPGLCFAQEQCPEYWFDSACHVDPGMPGLTGWTSELFTENNECWMDICVRIQLHRRNDPASEWGALSYA